VFDGAHGPAKANTGVKKKEHESEQRRAELKTALLKRKASPDFPNPRTLSQAALPQNRSATH